MTTPVFLGVDVGTTSTKTVAFSAEGEAVVSSSVGYPLLTPEPDRAEQDPAAVVSAALESMASCAAQARDGGYEVDGVSFSAAMHSLVGIDRAGDPLTPLLTWADSRAEDQAARLRSGPRGLALHRRTGTPVHPMAPVVKLRWYREREPDVAGRVHR